MSAIQLRTLTLVCASFLCLDAHAETSAQAKPPDARQERLEGLSKDDLQRIAPELATGAVALVEFADQNAGKLPAIDIAVPVNASADLVTRIVTDPASYPRFMPALDRVKVVAKNGPSIVYDWAFDLAVLQMRGRNVMTLYPAPKGRADAASRITIDSEDGDLGRGRYLFRVHPRGDPSLLVVSIRLDLARSKHRHTPSRCQGRSQRQSLSEHRAGVPRWLCICAARPNVKPGTPALPLHGARCTSRTSRSAGSPRC